MSIYFLKLKDAHGYMSNFALFPLSLKGKVWPSSEHYYQAQKFAGTDREEAIRLAKNPWWAAKMGRDTAFPIRSDWESVKDNVMLDAVMAKFTQNDGIKEQLLATGDEFLAENMPTDFYWGVGDGTGLNKLGLILMQVREEIRKNGTNKC